MVREANAIIWESLSREGSRLLQEKNVLDSARKKFNSDVLEYSETLDYIQSKTQIAIETDHPDWEEFQAKLQRGVELEDAIKAYNPLNAGDVTYRIHIIDAELDTIKELMEGFKPTE